MSNHDPGAKLKRLVRSYMSVFNGHRWRNIPFDKFLMKDLRLHPDDFYDLIDEVDSEFSLSSGFESNSKEQGLSENIPSPPDLTILDILEAIKARKWQADWYVKRPLKS